MLSGFLLRRAKREHVRQVMVGGEWVIRDAAHASVDVSEVEREIWERLQFDAAGPTESFEVYLRDFYRAWDAEDLFKPRP